MWHAHFKNRGHCSFLLDGQLGDRFCRVSASNSCLAMNTEHQAAEGSKRCVFDEHHCHYSVVAMVLVESVDDIDEEERELLPKSRKQRPVTSTGQILP